MASPPSLPLCCASSLLEHGPGAPGGVCTPSPREVPQYGHWSLGMCSWSHTFKHWLFELQRCSCLLSMGKWGASCCRAGSRHPQCSLSLCGFRQLCSRWRVQAPVERQRVSPPSAAAVGDEGWGGEPGTEEGAQSQECLWPNPAMPAEIRGRWGRCRGLSGERGLL